MATEDGVWMQKASREPTNTTRQVSQVEVFVAFLAFIRASSAEGRRDSIKGQQRTAPCSLPRPALSTSFDFTSEGAAPLCHLSPSSRKGAGSRWLAAEEPGN